MVRLDLECDFEVIHCLIYEVSLERERIVRTDPSRKLCGVHGGVALLGEHLFCTQGVDSSNLFISTRLQKICGRTERITEALGKDIRAHSSDG